MGALLGGVLSLIELACVRYHMIESRIVNGPLVSQKVRACLEKMLTLERMFKLRACLKMLNYRRRFRHHHRYSVHELRVRVPCMGCTFPHLCGPRVNFEP